MDQTLYDISIPFISSLQTQFSEQADFMQLMSSVFDPKYAFLIYSPIAYLLDHGVGRKLILTTVLAEWLNQVLKWFLHGERPYWYVHSSGNFNPEETPIKQFPITCELGPGHPSGHAMVTAAVWYIILDSALSVYNNYMSCDQEVAIGSKPEVGSQARVSSSTGDNKMSLESQNNQQQVDSNTHSTSAKLSIWTAYIILLLTVSVSRIFLGCHFPHQCLVGAILGLALAKWVSTLETRAVHFLATAVFIFSSAFGTFFLLQALGFDPSWTIKLATKHCVKREYIHMDTAPFFSIMRYCGFALGSGLGLAFPIRHYFKQSIPAKLMNATQLVSDESKSSLFSRNFSWLSAKILTALLIARLVDNLGLFVSHANLTAFYSTALVAYTMFSYAVVNLDHW